MKKVLLIGGIVLVVIGLLWLGFSSRGSSGSHGQGDQTPAPPIKWEGTMGVATDNVMVTYDGRSVHCYVDGLMTPGHFMVRVSNYAEMGLQCDLAVQRGAAEGYQAGDPSWLVAPEVIPVVEPNKTDSIPVKVNLPAKTPDGKYVLTLQVSKGSQSFSCPVLFDVKHNRMSGT